MKKESVCKNTWGESCRDSRLFREPDVGYQELLNSSAVVDNRYLGDICVHRFQVFQGDADCRPLVFAYRAAFYEIAVLEVH